MLAKPFNPLFDSVARLGEIARFWFSINACVFRGVPIRLVLDQVFECGVRAISTTIATGFFVGAIMAIQIELQLKNFGAEGSVGGIATSVTIRNVGPVLIGFILVGKVGALTTSILGTMRVTDQIDALTSLGVDPIRFIVAPRYIASVISSFLLLTLGLGIAILGGVAIAHFSFGVNSLYYISQIPRFVAPSSVVAGAIKSIAFGSIIGLVSCFRGYFVTGGAGGVGKAVRGAAVSSLVTILIADWMISLWI